MLERTQLKNVLLPIYYPDLTHRIRNYRRINYLNCLPRNHIIKYLIRVLAEINMDKAEVHSMILNLLTASC